jgi:inorganic pyrophosphatase
MKTYPSYSRFRPHPWHGIPAGTNLPQIVTAYIEVSPIDLMKYEIDKATGYTIIDRPQWSSAQCPTLYGFIPQTYCGDLIQQLTPGATSGDGDPLDICIITERPVNRADILVTARVIGGLQITDGGEADDKIIAVINNDKAYAGIDDLSQIPTVLVERIKHYFATYKMVIGKPSPIEITATYGKDHAFRVIEAALADYQAGVAAGGFDIF